MKCTCAYIIFNQLFFPWGQRLFKCCLVLHGIGPGFMFRRKFKALRGGPVFWVEILINPEIESRHL